MTTLELYKSSTLETFFKELNQLKDEDLISITNPTFIKEEVNTFPYYVRFIGTDKSNELMEDSTFIDFRWYHLGTKLSELKKTLAPIVSIRPDLIVSVDGHIKIGPCVNPERTPIGICCGRSTVSISSQFAKEKTHQFFKDLNNLKISDPAIIHGIIKEKYPYVNDCALFIVGDQIFAIEHLEKEYPCLMGKCNRDGGKYTRLFRLHGFGKMQFYVCLLSPSEMDAEFKVAESKKSECEKILEKYGKLSIQSDC